MGRSNTSLRGKVLETVTNNMMQPEEGNIIQYHVILSKLIKENYCVGFTMLSSIHGNIICKSTSLKGLESTKDI